MTALQRSLIFLLLLKPEQRLRKPSGSRGSLGGAGALSTTGVGVVLITLSGTGG